MSNFDVKTLVEPGLVGVTAGVLSTFAGGSATIGTIIGDMPGWVPITLSVAAASYSSEAIKSKVLPSNLGTGIASSLAKPVITGAAGAGVTYLVSQGNMNMTGIQTAFIIGASSELVGSYLFDNVVKKALDMKELH